MAANTHLFNEDELLLDDKALLQNGDDRNVTLRTHLRQDIDDAVDRLRPMAAAGGIDLRCSVGDNEAMVVCDRRQVVSAIARVPAQMEA